MILFSANAFFAFWATPYLLERIGIAEFGLTQLALQVAGYGGALLFASSETGRKHLTGALDREDREGASQIFSAMWLLVTASAIVLAPLFILMAGAPGLFFMVSSGGISQARVLFGCVFAAQLFGAWGGANASVLSARNRLVSVNALSISALGCRAVFIVAFGALGKLDAAIVGLAVLADRLLFWGGSEFLRRRTDPGLRPFRVPDGAALRGILPLGAWLFADQLGVILLLNAELVLANKFFGASGAGRYASILQLTVPFRSLSGILTSAIVPVVSILQARGSRRGLGSTVLGWSRSIGVFLALPAGLLCGFAPSVLALWLGPSYASLWPLLVVLILFLPSNLAVGPTISLAISHGKFSAPAIATIVAGAANIGCAYILARLPEVGLIGIAAAAVGTLTAKNLLVNCPHTDKLAGMPRGTTGKVLAGAFFFTASAAGAAASAARLFAIGTWTGLAIWSSIIASILIPITWWIGFSSADRRSIRAFMKHAVRPLTSS